MESEGHRNVIFRDLSATVGRTPMVELTRVAKGLPGRVVGKLEMRNPCGSVKDRVGAALIEDAEQKGILRAGMTLYQAPLSPGLRQIVTCRTPLRILCAG